MDLLKKYLPYLLFILPGLAFIAAGIGKLMGVQMMHDSFAMMGLPAWFGYFIGTCELAGGLGLFLNSTRKLAAAGLSIIMLGAIYFHVAYAVPSAVPAIVLLLLCLATIGWNWRRESAA